MEISGTDSSNLSNAGNVKQLKTTKAYTLNIDRTLRNKISACKKVFVDYNITDGGIIGDMDTATFELFRAACTAFYSRLPPEQGHCEIDMSEDKNRKAIVQQTYKVRREVTPEQTAGYTINLYPTRNRILINGKDIDYFMDSHLPEVHKLMIKPLEAGHITGASELNEILGVQMQTLLDQRRDDPQLLFPVHSRVSPQHEHELKVNQKTQDQNDLAKQSPDTEAAKCFVCARVVRSRSALCEKGQHWVHYNCDKLKSDEINRLHTDKGFIYNCKQCTKEDTAVEVPVQPNQGKGNSSKSMTLELAEIDQC